MNACFKANEMVSANSDLEFTMPEGFPRRRAAIGPLGEKLTLESLPPPQCNRWTPRRKAEVVAALTGGLLMEDEARERYSLSLEELAGWRRAVARSGIPGLRATQAQFYKMLHGRVQASDRA